MKHETVMYAGREVRRHIPESPQDIETLIKEFGVKPPFEFVDEALPPRHPLASIDTHGVGVGRSMARINVPCVVGAEGEPACIAGTEGCKVAHTVERFAPGVAGTFNDPDRMRAWEEAGRRIQAEDDGIAGVGGKSK